jgi:diacylglycerol O-acyltransferase / wax synthase
MSDTCANECLSFADAFFLYLEQPGAPLNVAAISAFEGVIPLDTCREYVESRLPLIPRFLKRVVIPPLNIGPPTLQYDQHFDICNHVNEIDLKQGTDAEWKSVVSGILSTHLDRSRPLWDITLLHGLKDERTGVIVRIHHCLVDGVAGVGLLNVLLDPSPVVPPMSDEKWSMPAPPRQDPGAVLLDSLINTCFSTGQALLTVHSELLRMAQPAVAPKEKGTDAEQIQAAVRPLSCIAPLGDLARLLAELAQPTERLPFNIMCSGPQKFDWTELPMEEIAAVRQACDATVNEVVLTVLGAALRRYAELHNVKVEARNLRLVVPVNVRTEGKSNGNGNQITFLPVDVPFDACEPRKFLSLVQERIKFSRTAHGADLVGMVAMLVGATPPPIQSLAGEALSRLPISLCNSICTNIHGPKTPLYLLGHKMLSTYPCVPIGGEMGMNCAVMSYDGTLFVGFTGDAQAIPDLSTLAVYFAESFAELRDAVAIPITKNKQPRRKIKVAVPEPQEVSVSEVSVSEVPVSDAETAPSESPTEAVFV